MLFKVGMENGIEGRSLAWVLEHPGCFVYGSDSKAALAAIPVAIHEYARWIKSHSGETWLQPDEIEPQVVDTWEVYYIDEDYELKDDGYSIEAWFLHDWKPLRQEEVDRGLRLLTWTREDLITTVKDLTPEVLDQEYPNERWNIAGILNHVGGAEWWYLDRLGLAFSREEVPAEPFERLEKVRSHFNATLPKLVGSRQVVGTDGEFWSPRKMLRRALWHERDHTIHIQKLLKG